MRIDLVMVVVMSMGVARAGVMGVIVLAIRTRRPETLAAGGLFITWMIRRRRRAR